MSILKTHEKIYQLTKNLQTQLHDQLTSMNVTLTGDETVLELIEKVSSINIITTTLTVTPNTTSIHYGGILTLTGTLATSTGTAMSGYGVALIENGEILSTSTTDSTGTYTLTYTISSMTSPDLLVKFMGKANYKASSVTVPSLTIGKADTVITLTANPTTVSSGGSTTLTVTLKDEWGNNLNGETVSILNGSTELYSGIIANNQYTITYSPTENITIKSYHNESEKYNQSTSSNININYGYLLNDPATSNLLSTNYESLYNITGSSSINYNSNGYYTITNSNGACSFVPIKACNNQNNIILSLDINPTSYGDGSIYFCNSNNYNTGTKIGLNWTWGLFKSIYTNSSPSDTTLYSSVSPKYNYWYHLIYTISGTAVKVELYKDDVLKYTENITLNITAGSGFKCGFSSSYDNSTGASFKNIQVKSI